MFDSVSAESVHAKPMSQFAGFASLLLLNKYHILNIVLRPSTGVQTGSGWVDGSKGQILLKSLKRLEREWSFGREFVWTECEPSEPNRGRFEAGQSIDLLGVERAAHWLVPALYSTKAQHLDIVHMKKHESNMSNREGSPEKLTLWTRTCQFMSILKFFHHVSVHSYRFISFRLVVFMVFQVWTFRGPSPALSKPCWLLGSSSARLAPAAPPSKPNGKLDGFCFLAHCK